MTSIPSVNLTPWISFGNWLWPSMRRQFFCAPSTSLKTMASAVLFDSTRSPSANLVQCLEIRSLSRLLEPQFGRSQQARKPGERRADGFHFFSDPTDGRPPQAPRQFHRDLFLLPGCLGERTKSYVEFQNRDNCRCDGLYHCAHRVSDIYPDRDLSCCGKRGSVCRHGCRQREHAQPPRG